MSLYAKARIEAELEIVSDTHIGSGIMEIELTDNSDDPQAKVSTLCRGEHNRPFIPGSSFRGMMRETMLNLFQRQLVSLNNSDMLMQLLGEARVAETDAKQTDKGAGMGRMRVLDLHQLAADETSHSRFHSSIDPVTHTTEAHKLFSRQVVPAGARFQLVIQLELVTDKQLELVFATLKQFNGKQTQTLGSSGAGGYGQFRCADIKTTGVTKEALQGWLKQPQGGPLQDLYQPIPVALIDTQMPLSELIVELQIHADEPLVSHDESLRRLIEQQAKQSGQEETVANILAQRTKDNKLLLPGSAVKGLLRAHTRKILLTLASQAQSIASSADFKAINQSVNVLTSQLFGHTEHKGIIHCSDWLSPQPVSFKQQQFNAIDRFTGGVAQSALYSVEFGYAEELHGKLCVIQPKALPKWALAISVLLARDALEGDLTIGWGKQKGFGRFRLAKFKLAGQAITTTEQLISLIEPAALEQSFQQLSALWVQSHLEEGASR